MKNRKSPHHNNSKVFLSSGEKKLKRQKAFMDEIFNPKQHKKDIPIVVFDHDIILVDIDTEQKHQSIRVFYPKGFDIKKIKEQFKIK